MPFEIQYELKAPSMRPIFERWRTYTPMPMDADQLAEAMRNLGEKKDWNLVTVRWVDDE